MIEYLLNRLSLITAHLSLGIEDHCFRLGHPKNLMPAAIEGDAHSCRKVQVQLRELRI